MIKRLREGKITERHARAVLVLPEDEQEELIEQVINQKLNVKQTEDKVRQKTGPEKVKAQTFQFSQDVTQARDEVGKVLKPSSSLAYVLNIKTKTMMTIMK